MIGRNSKQQGFTAVELLITLFIAAAFLVSGYQLYTVIIKDGGNTRAQTKAGNVAYDYLRRYSTSATNPCTVITPLTDSPTSVAGLSSVTVSINITCPYSGLSNISKVEATIKYNNNNPQDTVKYATYTNKGIPTTALAALETGLVGWWKFNGNANDSAGGNFDGTVYGATLSAGQNGQSDNAYSFNGTSNYISLPGTWGGASLTAISVSAWYNVLATTGDFQVILGTPDGTFLHLQLYSAGTMAVYVNTGTITPPIIAQTPVGTWHHVVITAQSGSTKLFLDNVQQGPTLTTAFANITASSSLQIGRGNANIRYFKGSIDDVRVYNRVLLTSEVSSLYAAGAQ